ncbi:NAP-domain-containing protein [Metschnikowia bicuspidata var. bicuspidata NRRL YB-4993]|uniref:NAP-domain-containing protein n=1 Tax=Metschnikowia bicuspidata var. bicuspidata NRRL YB-4993 TaxID=869754 RepID=A0A1A0HHY4_9ASCO|nr:NAP-domain-containing protein [Metschnikowia bicuspidata var. bicuspidata NRRL YB-4993]OBA23620.1 NAP-domain-containing protein [Metschnikowia bicuspidata var. bicuspidata NRRL YB-4993]
MSEPIRKSSDISKAPTPQNTPSSVANSYLKQQPTVSTINEEEENALSKQLANNPALLSMIQGKLGTLVGQQSGYIEQLPKQVKKRVLGLKAIQQLQMKMEAEFQKELLELEKKYFKKYEPLYEKRMAIINGEQEPTAAEIEVGEEIEAEHKDPEDQDADDQSDAEGDDEEISGVPNFWLTALENLNTVSETITERDSEVLQYLRDIRMEYLQTPGFELIFEFNQNPYLSNQVLTKTYHYQAELGYSGDFVYDHADGCEINWKSKENNVTINIERRKQRNKNTKQTRTIEKLTPSESFFNFFDPPKPPSADSDEEDQEDDENDEDADLEERLELDYQLGEEIKDRLIPRAIDWFTGDAVGIGYPDDFEEDEEEFDSEDENDDDDDDDDDINETGPKENPPECKQQ